ncbi:sensor histidine kinase [Rhodococcus spelaei]|uniref:histidine kinase n=1 Tax=Rhodococcus spelaei TaxID=2546320 RepID=A0A541BQY3_9NOCA|nr:sensor histidine kinase [Rhodococcus spelaei]TQF74705.1 sensor histidine kinase [Rhodococcus spelaei]
MKTQSPPVNRPWNLEGWGLRWKVSAVLVIPLTVAMVLGGLRVQDELSKAVNFSSAAKQVADVPAIVDLGTAFGTASAGFAANTMMPEDLQAVDAGIAKVTAAADNPDLSAPVADQLRRSLASIKSLRDQFKPGGTVPATLADDTTAVRSDLTRVIDEIVAPIDDPAVLAEHTRLVGAWSSQRRLADQVSGAVLLLKNPTAPLTHLISASGAELAMIDTLARSFPLEDTKINALREGVQKRTDMIDAAVGGQLPLMELRTSLLKSVAIYGSLIKESSDAITATVTQRADETRSAAIRDAAIVLATLLAAIVLGLLVARSLIRPIRRLRFGALQVANEDLPDAIERIKVGDSSAVTDFEPIPVHTTEDIGQLARAVDDMHGQALKLAGEQAHLRLQIGDMFETLARRSKSLVDQQLGLIENLEFEEKDPKRLESLFRLDHLAARMRRNGDNLLILSGNRVRRAQSAPVQLGDTVRAAMSEVENYQRVQVGSTPHGALSGAVATDVVHLLAELLDNSLRASPPDSKVKITFARAVDGGALLEIVDCGIGIPEGDLAVINDRLASGGEVSPETARHMGLFVVSRLAARHGITVRLRRTFETARDQGVTASVHIPDSLLVSPLEMGHTGPIPRVDTAGMQLVDTAGMQRVDTAGLPQVTVVRSDEMPPLVTETARPAPAPAPNPPGVLPQRTPGATGLPQRVPGAAVPAPLPPTPAPAQQAPAQQVPSATPPPSAPLPPVSAPAGQGFGGFGSAQPVRTESADVDSPPATRHRYRTNAAKTASFFQARPNATASQDVTTTGTPIFSGMVTDWLTDPITSDGPAKREWTSAADQGWTAAHRASEAPVEARTESGLPQRTPGHRLVPGGVDTADRATARPRLRDPEAVRDNLSRHQKGIREGRAASMAERTSIGGDR